MGRLKPKPFLSTPNGGVAPRCQAKRRAGVQCGAPARRGFSVCVRHGAGLPSRDREQTVDRRPRGRPIVHGLYSRSGRRKIADVVADLEAADTNLDDSDGEMRVLRATLAFLLGQADAYDEGGDTVRSTFALLERSLENGPLDAAEAAVIGRAMGEAIRLLGQTESWVRVLLDAARFIVKASKERADTRAATAESRALATLTRFIHVVRNILWEMLDEEHLDVLEARLVREVFRPNGLEIPDRFDALP